jgi:hypothetical protein
MRYVEWKEGLFTARASMFRRWRRFLDRASHGRLSGARTQASGVSLVALMLQVLRVEFEEIRRMVRGANRSIIRVVKSCSFVDQQGEQVMAELEAGSPRQAAQALRVRSFAHWPVRPAVAGARRQLARPLCFSLSWRPRSASLHPADLCPSATLKVPQTRHHIHLEAHFTRPTAWGAQYFHRFTIRTLQLEAAPVSGM